MTAAPPPVASLAPTATPVASSSWRSIFWAALGIVAVWIAFLALLTSRTSNPWVVNEQQLHQSDAVFLGRWVDRQAGRFEVAEELLHHQSADTVTIQGLPIRGLPTTDQWIIPVTRDRTGYIVTQGSFRYVVHDPNHDGPPQIRQGTIDPQCYPDTPDVRRQLDLMLQNRPSAGS